MIASAAATTTATGKSPFTEPVVNAEYVHRAAWKAGVLGAVNVLMVVVAVRLILLVAVVGAIWLTITAIRDPDPWKLGALAIYTVAVVVPTVWLSSRR